MRVYKGTKNISREEWIEARRNGIGGSDVGAILGVNPWKSAYAVYQDKIGDSIEVEPSYRMELGTRIEDFIAKEFELQTGKSVRRRNAILQHDDHSFMLANIDREIVGEKTGLEIKFISPFSAKFWQDENGNDIVPLSYEFQCLHYLAVTGWDKWIICALVGNERLIIREIVRDEETIQKLIEIESKFWNDNVLEGTPPDPSSADAEEYLRRYYPDANVGEVMDIEDQTEILERIEEVKELIKKLDDEKSSLESSLKMALKDAEIGMNSQYKVTYKNTSRTTIDGKKLRAEHAELFVDDKYLNVTNSRTLRITKIKNMEDEQ